MKKSAQPFEEMETLLANPRHMPEEILEQKENRRLILAAMERLTTEQRAVVVLQELQGFSYDEIAQILDIPLGTVKSRLNTARIHLCKYLSQERL